MTESDNSKVLIYGLFFLITVWILTSNSGCDGFNVVNNNGSLVVDNNDNQETLEDNSNESIDTQSNESMETQSNESNETQSNESNESTISGIDASESSNDGVTMDDYNINEKVYGRNHREGDKYKHVSYNEGKRGSLSPEVDKYFSKNSSQVANDFTGVGDNDGLAQYVSSNKKQKDDIFNAKELLPREENKEWFETHDNVKVKNRHLINVYRPIGVNTVASSLRNGSRDIRGDETNPRFVVSPWNQSSIDPDTNNRGLCKE